MCIRRYEVSIIFARNAITIYSLISNYVIVLKTVETFCNKVVWQS